MPESQHCMPFGTDGKRVFVLGIYFEPGRAERFLSEFPGARRERYGKVSIAVKWIPNLEDYFAGRPFSVETTAEMRIRKASAECAEIVASGRSVETSELRIGDHVRFVEGCVSRLLGTYWTVKDMRDDRPGWMYIDRSKKAGGRAGHPRSLSTGWSDEFPGRRWQIISRKE